MVVGVIDQPGFDGTEWIAEAPNALPITSISTLRRSAWGRGASGSRRGSKPKRIARSIGMDYATLCEEILASAT